ncbi:hypothetical protein J7L67_01835 [bacterium]|nr:hypothetical protein [bacterium]
MRKLTLFTALILLSTLMTFTAGNSYAGDKEWATVGKILTGVVGANIVYNIFTDDRPARSFYRTPSTYYPYPYGTGTYYSYGYRTPEASFSYYSEEYVCRPRVYYNYPSYYRGCRGCRRHRRHHRPRHDRRYASYYRR